MESVHGQKPGGCEAERGRPAAPARPVHTCRYWGGNADFSVGSDTARSDAKAGRGGLGQPDPARGNKPAPPFRWLLRGWL